MSSRIISLTPAPEGWVVLEIGYEADSRTIEWEDRLPVIGWAVTERFDEHVIQPAFYNRATILLLEDCRAEARAEGRRVSYSLWSPQEIAARARHARVVGDS